MGGAVRATRPARSRTFSSEKISLPLRKTTFLPLLSVCLSTTLCSSVSPSKANLKVTERFAALKTLPM